MQHLESVGRKISLLYNCSRKKEHSIKAPKTNMLGRTHNEGTKDYYAIGRTLNERTKSYYSRKNTR